MTQVVHTSIAAPSPEAPGAGFGGITRQPNPPAVPPGAPDFPAIRNSPEFTALRRRIRRFVFPMSALFFVWYLTYVLHAAFARDLLSMRLFEFDRLDPAPVCSRPSVAFPILLLVTQQQTSQPVPGTQQILACIFPRTHQVP